MNPDGVFRRKRIVEDQHVDQLGHVNNGVWLELIVELAHAAASAKGFGYEATYKLGGVWIVRRHEIDYHKPGLPGDEILEETWVSTMRGARSIRRSRFTRTVDESTLVSAVTHWAYVDTKTQRPRRIDPPLLQAFPVLDTEP